MSISSKGKKVGLSEQCRPGREVDSGTEGKYLSGGMARWGTGYTGYEELVTD